MGSLWCKRYTQLAGGRHGGFSQWGHWLWSDSLCLSQMSAADLLIQKSWNGVNSLLNAVGHAGVWGISRCWRLASNPWVGGVKLAPLLSFQSPAGMTLSSHRGQWYPGLFRHKNACKEQEKGHFSQRSRVCSKGRRGVCMCDGPKSLSCQTLHQGQAWTHPCAKKKEQPPLTAAHLGCFVHWELGFKTRVQIWFFSCILLYFLCRLDKHKARCLNVILPVHYNTCVSPETHTYVRAHTHPSTTRYVRRHMHVLVCVQTATSATLTKRCRLGQNLLTHYPKWGYSKENTFWHKTLFSKNKLFTKQYIQYVIQIKKKSLLRKRLGTRENINNDCLRLMDRCGAYFPLCAFFWVFSQFLKFYSIICS